MTDAIEELNWDVARWLLVLPNPRTPEAKGLLRAVDHWALLSTCDHDGVVSSYRSVKGLADCTGVTRPRLSLALLEPRDEIEAARVFRKLSSVCEQFLSWPLEPESAVRDAGGVVEHLVMCCRPMRDKAQVASAPQWQIVGDFLARARVTSAVETPPGEHSSHQEEDRMLDTEIASETGSKTFVADVVLPTPAATGLGASASDRGPAATETAPIKPAFAATVAAVTTDSEVLDLPAGGSADASILAALLGQAAGDLIECPVRPPMCPDARLAVTRDRRVLLLAVARQGLAELRSIGEAYRWLNENRALLAMAVPQFSIDPHQLPSLRLLVDHADAAAATLQPMLQTGHVTVQTYRTLRWGHKTGLLLEAA